MCTLHIEEMLIENRVLHEDNLNISDQMFNLTCLKYLLLMKYAKIVLGRDLVLISRSVRNHDTSGA